MESLNQIHRVREFFREEYDRAFRHEHWHVGIVDAPIHSFLEGDRRPDVRWLPLPPHGKYFADPFGLERASATTILFEEFDFRTQKGVISWVEEEAHGFSRPEVAIELDVHASYPFLIERDGAVFCIPETAYGGEVSLYRASDFPSRWTKDTTLLPRVAALDSTVFEHDGRFWLMCTDLEDGPFSKLRLWYAPDLRGPWTPHPANPVKTDLASARPAGTPFTWEGELYRPSQDSSKTYGGSVVLNRIVRLTTTDFREERVATVGPFQDGMHAHGVHTLAAVGDRTLVDGKRFAFEGRMMARNLRDSVGNRWPRTFLGA